MVDRYRKDPRYLAGEGNPASIGSQHRRAFTHCKVDTPMPPVPPNRSEATNDLAIRRGFEVRADTRREQQAESDSESKQCRAFPPLPEPHYGMRTEKGTGSPGPLRRS